MSAVIHRLMILHPRSTQSAPPLDELQQRAINMAVSGANVFLTGGPGTGKSFILQRIVADLREKNGVNSVLVTAPTGVLTPNL